MKKGLLILTIILSRIICSAQTTETYYTCPMHPEIHANKPGKCSKCGMD
ncbi:MAG: heavy metal-binding domain-containing protein, partial [Ginsengibacter sp.]